MSEPTLITNPLVGPLIAGPLDVVGDIHGEIDALESLLTHLGYGADGPLSSGCGNPA